MRGHRLRLGGGKEGHIRDAFFLNELGDRVERLSRPLADAVLNLDGRC